MKLKTRYKFGLLTTAFAVLLVVALVAARIITYTDGHFGRGATDAPL